MKQPLSDLVKTFAYWKTHTWKLEAFWNFVCKKFFIEIFYCKIWKAHERSESMFEQAIDSSFRQLFINWSTLREEKFVGQMYSNKWNSVAAINVDLFNVYFLNLRTTLRSQVFSDIIRCSCLGFSSFCQVSNYSFPKRKMSQFALLSKLTHPVKTRFNGV